MRGLIVDYCGVLDGTEEDQRRWRNLLASIRRAGVATAVLSNDPGGPAAEPIREWEYRGIVDAVVLSGEIGVDKPDAEAFRIAAETIDVPIRDCVMVDDSILNVRAAVDCGMVGVYYQQFDRAVVEMIGLFNIQGDF